MSKGGIAKKTLFADSSSEEEDLVKKSVTVPPQKNMTVKKEESFAEPEKVVEVPELNETKTVKEAVESEKIEIPE